MLGLTYLQNVSTLKLDKDKCTGCKMCTKVCPHNVFEIVDKKSSIERINSCMECGACALNCPDAALSVDSGVGCASGIINGMLKGTDPTCGCDGENSTCC